MIHPIYQVEAFRIIVPYTLDIEFDDGSHQTIDFYGVLAGRIYEPLRDLTFFNEVRIDPEIRTLVWPNGADFDPATLHDWPEHAAELVERAEQWRRAAVSR